MLGITDFWTYVLGTVAIVLLPGPNSIFVLTVGAQRGVRMGYRAAAGVFVGDTVLMVLAAAGVASLLRTYPPIFMVIKYAGAAYLAWVGIGIIRGALDRWRNRESATFAAKDAVATSRNDTDRDDEITRTARRDDVVEPRSNAGPVDENARMARQDDMAGPSSDAARAGEAGEPVGLSAGMRRPFRRALVVSLLNPKAILFVVSFFIQFVEPGYAHPALSFLVLGAVLQVFSVLYLTALIFGGQFLAGQFRRRRRLSAGVATGVGAVFVGFGIKLATATAG